MSKSDLEMEDPKWLPDDSGNNVQLSKSEMVGDNVENKGEESLRADAVLGDVNEKENGGENLNKCREDEKDTKDVMEVDGQTYHMNDGNEEVISREQIGAKNGIEEQFNTKGIMEAEDQTYHMNDGIEEVISHEQIGEENGIEEQINKKGIMGAEDQTYHMNDGNEEVISHEQIGAENGIEEQSNTKGTMEAEDQTYHMNDGNENVIYHEQIGAENGIEEQMNTKGTMEAEDQTYHMNDGNEEVIVPEQINAKNGIEELINTKGKSDEDLDGPKSATEEQTDAINGMVDQEHANGGMNKEYATENDTGDGNHVEYVKENLTEDLTVENPEIIGKSHEDLAGPKSATEEQTYAENGMVDQEPANGGMNKEYSMENDTGDGNHVEYVKENLNEDVPVENPEIIGKSNPVDGEHMVLGEKTTDDANVGSTKLPTNEDTQRVKVGLEVARQNEDVEMKDEADLDKDEPVKDDPIEQGTETVLKQQETDGNDQAIVIADKHGGEDAIHVSQHEAATPDSIVKSFTTKAVDHSGETFKTAFTLAALPPMGEGDDGTLEDQIAFMQELDRFHQEKALDFKPPKFYGQPLNCLKLWRAVIRLGGYDTVTGAKLWRQVGESFHPPKTCTTVSWTFRIFYEKSLLEYERHKTRCGELQLPVPTPPEASSIDGFGEGSAYQGSGSARARRDSASRAMQGWHGQRLSGHGEAGDLVIKDKNLGSTAKREKNLKSIGSLKQKRPNEFEHSNKVARTEISRQLATSVVDVGPPADWVKVNVRQTKECFEVYALVPGLLREEVRVQSDPAGRVVITGQPEQIDNPWGITPFKKVINLPTRIDPLETSAVVSLHGRLFVRVPFEQSK